MTITYRQTKGSSLLYGEVDENFRDLYEDTDLTRVLTNGNSTTLSMSVNAVSCNTITGSIPAYGVAPGKPGQLAYDSSFLYVCIATNTWKKVALAALV